MRHKKKYIGNGIPVAIFLSWMTIMVSCSSVKPYQRAYLNDHYMRNEKRALETLPQHVHAFREGASGAGNGKIAGGCGCN